MRNKAYIVANKQQEREVLDKLEQQGLVWNSVGEKPTEWVPSHDAPAFIDFPIILTDKGRVSWAHLSQLDNEEIVYDGRNKYIVSQEFMNELEKWRKNKNLINELVWYTDIKSIPEVVKEWWAEDFVDKTKTNNRLIAIIRWVNGEAVFKVEKPKKWVVKSKSHDAQDNGVYVKIEGENYIKYPAPCERKEATKFDTKEEAKSWANSHQEVIEVKE